MSIEHESNSEQTEGKNRTEQNINILASKLHDAWRASRWREETQDYEPRIKRTTDRAWSQAHGGAEEVDIANTSYEELPSDWQAENRASAEVAVTLVEEAIKNSVPLDESFIEYASSILHDKWLERNRSWAPPEQNKPYAELTEEEKDKDRVIIRLAIEVCSGKE